MRKNVAGQKIGAQMVSATDGSAFTGSVTVSVTVDAGTQATGTVGSGACTHEGNGYHTYAPSQAETNGDLVAFTFTGTGAVPATVQVYTVPTTGLLAPTTADRTLDVTATGAAGIDWANVEGPTTSVSLSGTTISTSQAIASVSGSVGSVTGAVGSVTGSVGGNVNGNVANVTAVGSGAITSSSFASGAITATAIGTNALTGAKFATDAITSAALAADAVAEIADAVWDEAISGHLTAGSTGNALNAAGSAGDPWSTGLPGAYGAGSAGYILGTNLNATISSRASQTSLDTLDDYVDTEVAAIKAKTDNLPAAPAATGDIPSAAAIADAVWDESTSGHTTSGTFGEQVKTDVDAILADTNELQTDWTNGGRLDLIVDAILDDTGTSGVLLTSAYDFAKGTVAVTESYNTDGAAPTPVQALMLILQSLTEVSISGTSMTIKKLDGSTTAATLTLNSATTPTSKTRAS